MFDDDGLWSYIENYDFVEALKPYHDKFVHSEVVKNFIDKASTSPFELFVEDYWSNFELSSDKLLIKYSIPPSIHYDSIIKAFPTDAYIEFLKYLWNESTYVESVKKKYCLRNQEVIALSYPIEVPAREDDYCPHCLRSNQFLFRIVLNQFSDFIYDYYCKICGNSCETALTKSDAEIELKIFENLYSKFLSEIAHVDSQLKKIKCPYCCGILNSRKSVNKYGYDIYCTRCKKRWECLKGLKIAAGRVNA